MDIIQQLQETMEEKDRLIESLSLDNDKMKEELKNPTKKLTKAKAKQINTAFSKLISAVDILREYEIIDFGLQFTGDESEQEESEEPARIKYNKPVMDKLERDYVTKEFNDLYHYKIKDNNKEFLIQARSANEVIFYIVDKSEEIILGKYEAKEAYHLYRTMQLKQKLQKAYDELGRGITDAPKIDAEAPKKENNTITPSKAETPNLEQKNPAQTELTGNDSENILTKEPRYDKIGSKEEQDEIINEQAKEFLNSESESYVKALGWSVEGSNEILMRWLHKANERIITANYNIPVTNEAGEIDNYEMQCLKIIPRSEVQEKTISGSVIKNGTTPINMWLQINDVHNKTLDQVLRDLA